MPSHQLQSVLYIGDEPDTCQMIRASLRLIEGLDVNTASARERAIALAHEVRPDLILMDVLVPALDASSDLKRILRSAPIADIPIVFLITKASPTEIARLIDMGAIGVIAKPFDTATLRKDLLDLWHAANTVPEAASERYAPAAVTAQVSVLTDAFLQRARQDVLRLREMIERAEPEWPSVFKEIEQVAHSIHGTAAMFGFPEVSASGGAIQRLVESATATDHAANSVNLPDVVAQLLARTDLLALQVQSAGRAPPSGRGMFQT